MTDLGDLGLSSYEEQAYRALLTTGPATARTVADRSGVPEGRIYDVLSGLEAREIVEVRSGDPRRYAPVDPDEAVDRLLARRLDELEERADRYRQRAAAARSSLAPTPPVDANFWPSEFGDEDATTLLAERLAKPTERLVMAAGVPYEAAAPAAYRSEIDAFVEPLETAEGSVELLLSRRLADALADEVATVGDAVSIRLLEECGVTFEVVDGTVAYVDVPLPFADGRRFGFVEIRDDAVARELERLFDAAWERAEPVA